MRGGLALASLLALALVAGCVGTPGEPRGLKAGLDDARDAAAVWGPSPNLLGAFAIEPFKRLTETDDEGTLRGEFVTHLDGSPGDGRAPAWVYVFLSDDDRCIFIALAGGLGVLAEGWEDCTDWADEEEIATVPGGFLDSTEVADILRGTDGWPAAGEDTLVTWELEAEGNVTYWTVTYDGPEDGSFAVVDAMTGEVLELEAGPWDEVEVEPFVGSEVPSDYETTHAWGSGTLVTVATPFSLEVEIDGDLASLEVTASVQTSVVGQATLRVSGPAGDVLVEPFTGSTSFNLDGLPAGTYMFTIEHGNAALAPSLDVYAIWPT